MSDDVYPTLLRLEHYPPSDFECSAEEQNAFLHERAIIDQDDDISRTYLVSLRGIIVGFFTLTMDAIELQTKERPRSSIPYRRLPAVKLAQLAVHVRWERQGIGQQIVAMAVGIALELRKEVGCRYLTVDARTPDLTGWYKKQEFEINKVDLAAKRERAAAQGKRPDELPTSMRLDLHSLLKDLREHYPSDFGSEA